jgi:hypothetical protein
MADTRVLVTKTTVPVYIPNLLIKFLHHFKGLRIQNSDPLLIYPTKSITIIILSVSTYPVTFSTKFSIRTWTSRYSCTRTRVQLYSSTAVYTVYSSTHSREYFHSFVLWQTGTAGRSSPDSSCSTYSRSLLRVLDNPRGLRLF